MYFVYLDRKTNAFLVLIFQTIKDQQTGIIRRENGNRLLFIKHCLLLLRDTFVKVCSCSGPEAASAIQAVSYPLETSFPTPMSSSAILSRDRVFELASHRST
jgi:hypothetical protein